MSKVEQTLIERGNKYGDFTDHARVTQAIKQAMYNSPNWPNLPDWMKEGMEMTAHKYGRALCGDWSYLDTFHDVVGYNRLIEERLEK